MRQSVIGRTTGYARMAVDMRTIQRCDDADVRRRAARHLAERMGRLRGLPQKIGQIMSMSHDDPVGDAMQPLTDQAKPLPLDELIPVLEQTWGKNIEDVVQNIDPNGHAASLGQVHRATLLDGRDVAIKIAYPGIEQAITSDLKVLGWLSSAVGDLRRGFSLADYRAEILRDLREELDYRTELNHQQQFHQWAQVQTGVVVPQPLPELCGEKVLVNQWVDGARLSEAVGWSKETRSTLARTIVSWFFQTVFEAGQFHADPHPGNYRFRNTDNAYPEVILYDYGSVGTLSERDRLILIKLIHDTATMQASDPFDLLVSLGFDQSLLEPVRPNLPAACCILFEPFSTRGKFDLSGWRKRERLDDVLGEHRWNFRLAGPAKLILLMRAFSGVIYYLEELDAPVSWNWPFEQILDRHLPAISKLDVPRCSGEPFGFDTIARHLRVEVKRSGQTTVSLTFPAHAIEDLSSLLDDEVAQRIAEQGVNVDDIVRASRRSGYAPGDLFRLEENQSGRAVRVWLA